MVDPGGGKQEVIQQRVLRTADTWWELASPPNPLLDEIAARPTCSEFYARRRRYPNKYRTRSTQPNESRSWTILNYVCKPRPVCPMSAPPVHVTYVTAPRTGLATHKGCHRREHGYPGEDGGYHDRLPVRHAGARLDVPTWQAGKFREWGEGESRLANGIRAAATAVRGVWVAAAMPT